MADKDKVEQVTFEVRRTLADAYTFVSGQQAVRSFSALTPEELFDQQIERIAGKDTDARPNELHRIDAIETALQRALSQVKALPADAFKQPDESTDVNSPPDAEDPIARQKRLTGQT
jgi:hypothetical protein